MTKPQAVPADDYLVRPDPADPRLSERVFGVDQTGTRVETTVVVERPLTIYLNAQEIVTAMTIGDYPEYLAIGFLLSVAAGMALGNRLFGIAATDPATYGGVFVLLAMASLAAAYVPAWRAGQVNVVEALRQE